MIAGENAGAMSTIGNIDPQAAPAASPAAPVEPVATPGRETPPACLNCHATLSGAFCAACGQKTVDADPSLRDFLHDTTHELTHWEGRLLVTLRALFLRPGVLTEDFLAGRRARWLPPLRLYLICSLTFFAVTALVDAVTPEVPDDELARITIENPDGSKTLTPEARAELAEGLTGRLFGVDRLERAAAQPEVLDNAFIDFYPRAMFVLLPLFALLTWTVWRRRRPRYPAHLYTALHVHAAWFGAFAVSTATSAVLWKPAQAVVELAAFVFCAVYGVRAMRRIFGESWPRTLAKSAVVTFAYMLCLFPVSLLLLAWVLFTI
jgi:hypothetical protein